LKDWDRLQPVWDEYVAQHPKGSIFHTSEMIQVHCDTVGHEPFAVASVTKDGKILALLSAVRVQTLSSLFGALASRSIWFAEPLCSDDPQSVDGYQS
jgi:hypothetical protein